jgi:hypothetical protein
MRRVTIAVIGNAKTTMANVEALIGDIVDSVDEVAIATVFKSTQSDGQVWAEQYARDKDLRYIGYAGNDYDALFSDHRGSEIKLFILWDDEDPECQLAASVAQSHKLPAFDLTDGLIMIPLNSEPIARPVKADIPEVETKVSDEPTEPQLSTPTTNQPIKVTLESLDQLFEDLDELEAEDDELEDEDEDDSDYDLGELMTLAIEEAGRIFARSFAEEFKKHLGK